MKLVVGLLLLVVVCHNTVCFPFQTVPDFLVAGREELRDSISFRHITGSDCSWDARNLDYRGPKSETMYGHTCQNWLSQSSNEHSMTPSEYPDEGLGNHNYCRNPDHESYAWCYTTNGPRWEYCDVGC